MKIKDIVNTALAKTKNVMWKIIDFLKKKRFSVITLIVALILCLDISSCIVQPNAREPTTALAADIVVSDTNRLYCIPAQGICYTNNTSTLATKVDCIVPLIYLEVNTNEFGVPQSIVSVYQITGGSGTTNKTYAKFKINAPDNFEQFIIYQGTLGNRPLARPYPSNNNYDMDLQFSSTVPTIYFYTSNDMPNGAYLNRVEYDVIYWSQVGKECETYKIYYTDLNGSVLLWTTLYISNCTYSGLTLPYTGAVQSSIISEVYSIGTPSYEVGYQLGYKGGYDYGVQQTLSDINPFSIVTDGIDSLLSMDIIGNMSLGDILKIGFGFVLLGYVLKVFLHA